MNLTQTKRWNEFADWYEQQDYILLLNGHEACWKFVDLEFEFQEGVFRKFIHNQIDKDQECNYSIEIVPSDIYIYYTLYAGRDFSKTFQSFQELVTWFFNNQ